METLDKHFRHLAKAAFARHGFASEQLISQWGVVAGATVAQFCVPDKIKWPRTSAEQSRKTGGTLVLRAMQGRALELHYEIPHIMERVNQFLGYGAIADVKIIQGHTVPKAAKVHPQPMKPDAAAAWQSKIDDIADHELKSALARLAALAAPSGPKPTSPQVKLGIGPKPQTQLGK